MRADNLLAKEGFMKNVDIVALCCDPARLIPMCYGNNPGSPYMTVYLPDADGQTTMNSSINYYGFPPAPLSVGADYSRSYRLAPDEAVVIVGKTPPPERFTTAT
jgi:hypothetical protein